MNKKNLLTKVLFFMAMIVATSVFAIPKGPCDQPKDVCCEEPPAGPFAFSYPKDVGLSCPRDFYFHGEFLWMKPSEEGLEYVMHQDSTGTASAFPLQGGEIEGFSTGSQEWDWRPGFRVGFGFYTNYDSWNVDFNWTYIRIKADSERDNGGSGTLLPLFYSPGSSTELDVLPHASARWSGDYNTLDLMFGKPYHVSRYYISNPMFGIRSAWIDQDYHIRNFINEIKRSINHKNDYWSVGLRGLYEGDFLLGSGWSIYGKAAFALLFGKFDTMQQAEAIPGNYTHEYVLNDSFYSVQPNAELAFGLCWSKFYHKNQYKVALKAGYEFHHWWDQNQIRKFFFTNPVSNDTVSRGDLSFNGFAFCLHFDF